MIQSRQILKYQNKNLIEKVVIQPPFRYNPVFQDSGCFLYAKGNTPKLLSSEVNIKLKDKEAVLLKCGAYVTDWLQTANSPTEIIVVHLLPDILKQLYSNELPKVFKQRKATKQVKVIVPDDMMKRFIESLEFYFHNPQIVNEDLLELKLKELILLLVQSRNAASVLELIEDLYYSQNVNFKNVIELHKYENLSISELASLCGLSLSSFK
ncbi:MAG: AraC family transcriptional regulator, partial [Bacteroidota bacterium]